MKSELSSFLDDELETHRHPAMIAAMTDDSELRSTWDGYQLIGDTLRGVAGPGRDFVTRVMSDLEQEPVVLAPPGRRIADLAPSTLAIAATAAGIAVVAWLALDHAPLPLQGQGAALASAQPAAVEKPNRRMQEYFVAHQTYSPANRIQGGTSYVRSVSVALNSAAK